MKIRECKFFDKYHVCDDDDDDDEADNVRLLGQYWPSLSNFAPRFNKLKHGFSTGDVLFIKKKYKKNRQFSINEETLRKFTITFTTLYLCFQKINVKEYCYRYWQEHFGNIYTSIDDWDLVKFLVCHVDVPCWHTKQRAHVRGNVDEDDNSDGNNRHYHFGDNIYFTHNLSHNLVDNTHDWCQ